MLRTFQFAEDTTEQVKSHRLRGERLFEFDMVTFIASFEFLKQDRKGFEEGGGDAATGSWWIPALHNVAAATATNTFGNLHL